MAYKKRLKNILIEHCMYLINMLMIGCDITLIVWFQVNLKIARSSQIILYYSV